MGILVQKLIDQARDTLVDVEKALYTDKQLGEFAYQGEQAIGYLRPEELSLEYDLRLGMGSRQSLPADGVRLRGVLYNRGRFGATIDGAPIRLVPRGVLDDLGDWRHEPGEEIVQEYCYDERQPRHFDVIPPMVDGNSVIRIDYEREPPIYAYTSEALTNPSSQETVIADKYGPAIVEWMLYRALSREDDVTAAQVDGSTHYQRFFEMLGITSQGDAANTLKDRMQLK